MRPLGTLSLSTARTATTTSGVSKNSVTNGRSTMTLRRSDAWNSPDSPKPVDASEHHNALHPVLIVNDVQHFLHGILAAAVIGLA
jgi:hypothetical protein